MDGVELQGRAIRVREYLIKDDPEAADRNLGDADDAYRREQQERLPDRSAVYLGGCEFVKTAEEEPNNGKGKGNRDRKLDQLPDGPSVHVAQLNLNVDDAALKDAFEDCGEVIAAKVMVGTGGTANGKSRGTGIVVFAEESAQKFAIETMDGVELQGRAIRVREKYERLPDGPSIHVAQLDLDIDDEALKIAFEDCGEVIAAKVMVGTHGRRNGN